MQQENERKICGIITKQFYKHCTPLYHPLTMTSIWNVFVNQFVFIVPAHLSQNYKLLFFYSDVNKLVHLRGKNIYVNLTRWLHAMKS